LARDAWVYGTFVSGLTPYAETGKTRAPMDQHPRFLQSKHLFKERDLLTYKPQQQTTDPHEA
jgi:hypothetical protein